MNPCPSVVAIESFRLRLAAPTHFSRRASEPEGLTRRDRSPFVVFLPSAVHPVGESELPKQINFGYLEGMNFFELVHARRSVRMYQERSIDTGQLDRILEAVNRAPSAGNLQAYSILIVRESQTRKALSEAALNQDALVQAPLVLAFITRPAVSAVKYSERGASLYALQDATIACAYAQLAAAELGLATVWVGAFEEEAVSRILKVAKDDQPVALLPIGYPAESPQPTPRRSLAELVKEVV